MRTTLQRRYIHVYMYMSRGFTVMCGLLVVNRASDFPEEIVCIFYSYIHLLWLPSSLLMILFLLSFFSKYICLKMWCVCVRHFLRLWLQVYMYLCACRTFSSATLRDVQTKTKEERVTSMKTVVVVVMAMVAEEEYLKSWRRDC